ncbi:MAG: VWA domain-containing protein, partial [Pirellulaceae bacterium]|nr:VWA domain-containing protein [Pirellulaceae bacterium]
AADNHRASQVQVVDRKTQVLLIAGGPSREFRFLRNLLFRDPEVVSHVWLQSGKPGISQESDQLIFEFPEIPDELYKYDCIVAFDPNWLELTAGQVDLLEKWVAEKAGGLVVVAGPVNTPRWANLARGNDRRIDSIKGLYPVSFYSWRSSTISLGRFGGSAVWPIQFSDDGYQAEFLWLSEDQVSSEAAWSSFDGVYGYYAVKDPKPGARIYSRFADPDTAIDGDLPIYMAGHLYGAGRVFFQASGELWRIRALDDTYFQQYYTKLIRWASQGRLLRDSRHGVLLVDKERCLIGDHVGVQAILNDSQHQPLTQAEVEAELVHPKGGRTPLILRRTQDGAREGMFTAQITAAEDGDYRIELMPPGADADELLTRTVLVRTPALETEQPQRNDRGLRALTRENGQYLVGAEAALDASQTGAALPTLLTAQDQTTFLPGVPDRRFAQTLRGWLIALICGALCWEWIIRRLSKLA